MPPADRIVTVRLACGHTRAYTGTEAPPSDAVARAGRYRCTACGRVTRATCVHIYEGSVAA